MASTLWRKGLAHGEARKTNDTARAHWTGVFRLPPILVQAGTNVYSIAQRRHGQGRMQSLCNPGYGGRNEPEAPLGGGPEGP